MHSKNNNNKSTTVIQLKQRRETLQEMSARSPHNDPALAGLPQLIEDLQRLSEDQDSADVVFICGRDDEKIYAHRSILMARLVKLELARDETHLESKIFLLIYINTSFLNILPSLSLNLSYFIFKCYDTQFIFMFVSHNQNKSRAHL